MTASLTALDGCRIERVLDSEVEIVEATPRNRAFADRLTESLGVCLKYGPDHDVIVAGRVVRYPRDSVCVRAPGTVWSTRATGNVGFLAIDIEPGLLPDGGLRGGMAFAARSSLPDLRRCAAVLRSRRSTLETQAALTDVLNALIVSGLVTAPWLDPVVHGGAVDRARELLTTRLDNPPSLTQLADTVGVNRFVLLREFRRRVGVPPHAFVLRLRVDRARARLARGDDIAEVAHALGFADQSHLSRVFKRNVGLSPGAYRRAARLVR